MVVRPSEDYTAARAGWSRTDRRVVIARTGGGPRRISRCSVACRLSSSSRPSSRSAERPSPPRTDQPAVGTPVTYVDPEGIIRGEVTVREVVDPFTDHEPSYPPPEGMRYVYLVTTFQAAIDQPFDAQPWQVVLQDTDGYLYSYQNVPRPECRTGEPPCAAGDASIPDFQGQTMAPDNRISGAITFTVPATATLDRVVYQPASDRLIELADLGGGAGPALGDAVTYTDTTGASATITTQVIDPFTGHDPAYPPPEGTRFVVLQPVFENTGQLPFYADPNDFLVRDTSGRMSYQTTVYQPVGFSVPTLEGQTTSPGDRVSGYVGFAVPTDAQLVDVLYYPESARISTLVDLVGGGGATPTESSGSPAPEASAAPAAPTTAPAPAASLAPGATAGVER